MKSNVFKTLIYCLFLILVISFSFVVLTSCNDSIPPANTDNTQEIVADCVLKVSGGQIKRTDLTEKSYQKNTQITIIANVLDTQNFVGWFEDDVLISTDRYYTFTLTSSRTLEARCVEKPHFYNIEVTGGKINMESPVIEGSKVIFTAENDTDRKEFYKWTIIENGQTKEYTTPTITINDVQSSITATAYYYEKVLISAYILNKAEPFETHYIIKSTGTVDITAPDITDFGFKKWVDSKNKLIGSNNTITISNKTSDYSIYASFEELENRILTVVGGHIKNTSLAEKGYRNNSNVTIVADTKNTQYFVGWYDNEELVSTESTYSFSITSSKTMRLILSINQSMR